ncbi:MAG TPA: DUF411 domain-containing protein [Burkholderiales bacterium]
MITRRSFVHALGAIFALGALPRARAQYATTMQVYKSPACGCCQEWEKHMRASGFRLETHNLENVVPIKQKLGVPEPLWSCHTATLDGYVFEGHVPSADIRRLLRERAKVKGLAVPGMVVGSPGMEQGPPQPYATLAFDERGRSQVYERH